MTVAVNTNDKEQKRIAKLILEDMRDDGAQNENNGANFRNQIMNKFLYHCTSLINIRM